MLPRGFWPVMLTPFNDDGSINYGEYENLIDFYIESGSAGLFASCGSSEMTELSHDEMLSLASKAVDYAGGRVPVVGGAIIVDSFEAQVGLVKRMAQTGVDAVTISMSQFGEPEEAEELIIERIETLLEMTKGITLGLYECPHPYRRNFSPVNFARLVSSGRFCFHKDTCCDAEQIKEKLELTKDSDITFLNAHFPTLPQSLQYGGSGYCGVVGNFFPDLMSAICEKYFQSGVTDTDIYDFVIASDEVMKNKYPRSPKIFLNLLNGVIRSNCRVNVPLANEEDVAALSQLLEEYKNVKKNQLIGV